MNLRDWYFKQIVSQGDMDEAFDWSESADHAIVDDLELFGIISAGNGVENSPPDLNALVDGPIVVYDKDGQRTYDVNASQLVDCSQDEYGVSTVVATPGNEKWISVFIRFERRLEDPEIDGNSNEVYTRKYEDSEIFVRQGAEAVIPTASRPALLTDAILLFDLYRINGQTTFQNADFYVDRREDWYRFVGATLGTISHGTAHDAVAALYTLLDGWAAAMPFTFSDTWFGAVAVQGSAPPVTTVQEALDAIVYDLAVSGAGAAGTDFVGASDHTSTPGGYVSWAATSAQGAIEAIANAIDAHIGGGAPQHAASAITFAPVGIIAATDVQAAIAELLTDFAAQASPSGAAQIGWNDDVASGYYTGLFGSSTVQAFIKSFLEDLGSTAASAGSDRVGKTTYTTGGWTIASQSVSDFIDAMMDDLVAQVAASGATRVGYESPWGVGMTAHAALDLRPERDKPETIDGNWLLLSDPVTTKSLLGGTVPPGMNLDKQLPRQAFWGNRHWAQPFQGTKNYYQLTAYQHNDICMFWSNSNVITGSGNSVNRPFIAVLQEQDGPGSPHLLIFDPADVGSGPVRDWTLTGWAGHVSTNCRGQALCSDGTNIYISFIDAVGNDFIGEWVIGSGTAGWKYDFASSGIFGVYPTNRIRVVNDSGDIVATLGAVAQGGAGMLQALSSAGASLWRNDGDCAGGDTPTGGLCSDGTRVYFTSENVGVPYSLNAALISTGGDPTLATPVSWGNRPLWGVAFDGRFVWTVTSYDDISPTYATIGYYDTVADVATIDAVPIGAVSGAAASQRSSFDVVIDGLNLWFHDFSDVAPVAGAVARVHSMPLGTIFNSLLPNSEPPGQVHYLKLPGNGIRHLTGPANLAGRMCFDGDSIWILADNDTNIRELMRIPRAGSR